MKTLIIYDSLYGNTEKLAKAMADQLAPNSHMAHVKKIKLPDLAGYDAIIVGSPTHGGRPTENMQVFLKKLHYEDLKNVKVAAFDTRMESSKQKFLLKILMKIIGYASPRILSVLKDSGGQQIGEPNGFYVLDKEGPLKEGEELRAATWAESLV